MQTKKYGRTYHVPFSAGVHSDDRILWDWEGILEQDILVTEKLDGENTCIKASGVYARSHAGPTHHPWAKCVWAIWQRIGVSLGTLEIFGENLYAIHSINYKRLPYHFYVFAMREGTRWLSWEETLLYADLLELPTIPVLEQATFSESSLKKFIEQRLEQGSVFGGSCEGVVIRNPAAFETEWFKYNVLKYVRANHVQTTEHWTRAWKRATLWYEHPNASKH